MLSTTISTHRTASCLTARGWWRLALALMLLAAMSGARAAEYLFSGGAISGCTLAGSIYTCASLPMSAWNDSMTIATGFTVNVNSDVNFGYNQTLKMSGTARLSSSGTLSVADVARANLQISGGFLNASGALSVGNQDQTITANLSGGSLNIGSGSDLIINGRLSSTGAVAIASHAIINGNISGSTITTGSPVKLTGNVVAGSSFTLASGSTMTGNITAPVVRILASSVVVTGDINASTSVTLESGNRINGDVSTGTLTLNSSNAIVDGNATVDQAVLGWAGRVTEVITCRSGDTAGKCSCVVNNSGYAVNSANGPRCSGPAPVAPTAPHHIEIRHDGNGLTCAPDPVTVRACANADCSTLHTGGASVTIAPVGTSVTIGSSGSANATVASTAAGAIVLSAGSGTVCKKLDGTAGTCDFTFANSAFLVDAGPAHRAESDQRKLYLTAVRADPKDLQCGPAFSGEKLVKLTCQYVNPNSGTRAVRLNDVALNQGRNKDLACDTNGVSLPVTFNAEGKAELSFRYADVGRVQVTASIATPAMSGEDQVTTTPASFTIATAGPYVAGDPFSVTIEGRNTAGDKTPNFGRESPASVMAFTSTLCEPSPGRNPALEIATAPVFASGAFSARLRWPEVGRIYLATSLSGERYLNVSETASGAMVANSNCGGSAGPFTASFLRITRTENRPFYYSGQPIPINVTARSSANTITENYRGNYAREVSLRALSTLGALEPNRIPASAFTATGANAAPAFTFTNLRTAPTTVSLRAEETLATAINSSTNNPEANALIRSGRLRLSNRFGASNRQILLPVAAEYWSGNSWVHNVDDSFTTIPLRSVGLTARPEQTFSAVIDGFAADPNRVVTLLNGRATIPLSRSTGIGWVDVAINLGAGTDTRACAGANAARPGANLVYLRSLYGGCNTDGLDDPSARATFGVFAAETRRIIHVRESFR